LGTSSNTYVITVPAASDTITGVGTAHDITVTGVSSVYENETFPSASVISAVAATVLRPVTEAETAVDAIATPKRFVRLAAIVIFPFAAAEIGPAGVAARTLVPVDPDDTPVTVMSCAVPTPVMVSDAAGTVITYVLLEVPNAACETLSVEVVPAAPIEYTGVYAIAARASALKIFLLVWLWHRQLFQLQLLVVTLLQQQH